MRHLTWCRLSAWDAQPREEMRKILAEYHDDEEADGDVELAPKK
jgi:hypothetical protein